LVYGFTKAVTDGWSSSSTLFLISVGVVLLGAFVAVEIRSSAPLLPMRVVLERNRGGSYLATLLLVVGMFAMFLFVSYYMQQILHYSAVKAGVAFLPFALGVIVAAGLSTPLVPKVGPRAVMTTGLLIAALGMLWLTQIGVHTSYWTHLLPQQIVMSLGMGLAFPALSSAALTKVGESEAGVASSLINTAQQIGASLGLALLNTIAALATVSYIASHRASPAPDAIVHGYTVAFAVGAAILAAGALVSFAFLTGPKRDRGRPEQAEGANYRQTNGLT
jgi:predicted MFS family arabinose efflux permease